MRSVAIESPFAGDYLRNFNYVRAALRDSLMRGEAPFASHALYPLVLNDRNPRERSIGMRAGLSLSKHLDSRIFYRDFGSSRGVEAARTHTRKHDQDWEERVLGPNWEETLIPVNPAWLREFLDAIRS